MKKATLVISSIILLYFSSCNSNTTDTSISSNPEMIAVGETSFTRNCSGCHNFRQDGIGPKLSGITTQFTADWIKHFISDPTKIIESGDEHAVQLLKKYKVAMPAFTSLKEDEMNGLIAFLNTHKSTGEKGTKARSGEITNPIPEPIKFSGLVAGLNLITQIPASSDSGKMPLARITQLGLMPNTNDLFILDLRGKLYKLQHNKPAVYMDMAKLNPAFIHEPGLATGFGSFAFHPGFAKTGLLYTTHTEAAGSAKADFGYSDSIKVTLQWVLTEWKTGNPAAANFSGTGRELLRVNMVAGIHGVQEISFNPLSKPGDKDYGLLYIGIGDGGAVENGYPFLAHSKEKIWGTILRIDPAGRNSGNRKYGIPADNPFTQNQPAGTLGEIYAYGFRNPHRISWSKSGDMLACNVGQANIESINLILPGRDYGWPIREGNFVLDEYGDMSKLYTLPANDSAYKITYPVAEYDHDEGKAISGGFEYWGEAIPQLNGKYLFGDIPTGRLFYVEMADIKQGKMALIKEWQIAINGVTKPLKELCGSQRVDLHFGRDAGGELYILTKADGRVYKLVSAEMK
jgi:cytochrome c2